MEMQKIIKDLFTKREIPICYGFMEKMPKFQANILITYSKSNFYKTNTYKRNFGFHKKTL